MNNILDYLYWRGDLSLNQAPLNELDGLVLTRFSYMPFEELEFDSNETVKSLCEKLKTLPTEKFRIENDTKLIELLIESDRYNQIPVTDFVKHNDYDAVVQFAAITLHLPDDTLYIAYCGTDSTLVGWKEDFYMSFMQDVPAQKEALGYAIRSLESYPVKQFYIGGHSKGGNLAVYAAVNLPDAWKEKLVHVSNYDGPGFPDSYIESHDFASVVDRLYTFIPQESVFGRIHEHAEGFQVVESSETGLRQHDIYSWGIHPTMMSLVEKAQDTSEIAYKAIQNILTYTSPEQRKAYVDRMFDMMVANDATTFSDVVSTVPKMFEEMRRANAVFTPEERKENQEMMMKMARSVLDAAVTYNEEKLPDLTISNVLEKIPLEKITDIIPDSVGRLIPGMEPKTAVAQDGVVQEELPEQSDEV